MNQERKIKFISQATSRGFTEDQAEFMWDWIIEISEEVYIDRQKYNILGY